MSVLYKAFQSVLKNKQGKKLYFPRVMYTGNVGTNQLAKEIAAYSSLTPGDVKNTLDNLVTVVRQHLHASETVTLDGFGTFRFVMKSGGNGVETSDKVSAAQSWLTVRFLPSSTRNTDRTMSNRPLADGARCMRMDKVQEGGKAEEVPGSGPGTGGSKEPGEAPDPAA